MTPCPLHPLDVFHFFIRLPSWGSSIYRYLLKLFGFLEFEVWGFNDMASW